METPPTLCAFFEELKSQMGYNSDYAVPRPELPSEVRHVPPPPPRWGNLVRQAAVLDIGSDSEELSPAETVRQDFAYAHEDGLEPAASPGTPRAAGESRPSEIKREGARSRSRTRPIPPADTPRRSRMRAPAMQDAEPEPVRVRRANPRAKSASQKAAAKALAKAKANPRPVRPLTAGPNEEYNCFLGGSFRISYRKDDTLIHRVVTIWKRDSDK